MLSGETGNDITIVADGTGGVIDASGVTFDTGNESVLFDLTAGGDDIVTGTSLDDLWLVWLGMMSSSVVAATTTLNGRWCVQRQHYWLVCDVLTYDHYWWRWQRYSSILVLAVACNWGRWYDGITLGAGDDTVIFTAAAESTNDVF